MPKPTKPTDTTATTPEENNYCAQHGTYHDVYSGDLDVMDTEYEARDAKVDATRKEFAKTPKDSKLTHEDEW